MQTLEKYFDVYRQNKTLSNRYHYLQKLKQLIELNLTLTRLSRRIQLVCSKENENERTIVALSEGYVDLRGILKSEKGEDNIETK